jgi:hypothetical protein
MLFSKQNSSIAGDNDELQEIRVKIVVSSNCQTSGITIALRMLLPDATVEPFPYAGLNADQHQQLITQLAESDVWVVTAPPSFVSQTLEAAQAQRLRIVTLPELYFDAFHPDLVYAWSPNETTVNSPAGPYNSAIALWAWRRRLSADQTIALFTPEVFSCLGYTERWSLSADRLKLDFSEHGYDYREFLLPLQRKGVFMHTVNHPTVAALAQMSRLAANRIGMPQRLLAEPIENFMTDGLMAASSVWPVYPTIANALGMEGSWTWKLPTQQVIRLNEFIEASFAMYAQADVADFSCHQLEWPVYESTLACSIGPS